MNVLKLLVGRPGLDPGTLGLKGVFRWLRGISFVEDSMCFVGNGVVSCRFGFVELQKYEAYNEACSGTWCHPQRHGHATHFRVCSVDCFCTGSMTTGPAKTVAELAERMRFAKHPTEDDVTVLPDGRRLDSKEAVEAWLIEVDAIRAAEVAADAHSK